MMFNYKHILFSVLLFLKAISASAQWQPCEGIVGANIRDVIIHDSIIFIGNPGNGIFMRDVSDTAWEPSCVPYPGQTVRSTGRALFCYGPMAFNLLRSLDNGNSWHEFGDYWEIMGMDVCDSCLYIIDYQTLKRSCDDGESWTVLYPSPTNLVTKKIYAQQDVLFCTLNNVDSIYQSSDLGDSWTRLPITGLSGTVNDIYLNESVLWAGSSTGAFIFNEQADDWILTSDSIPGGTTINSFCEDEAGLASCTSTGYYRYNEEDSIWYAVNSGLESKSLYVACNIGSSVIVATASGPFIRQFDSLFWESDYNTLYQRDINQVFKVGERIYALSSGRIYFSDDLSEGFQTFETQGFCSSGKIIITDTAWYAASACGFLISLDSGMTWTPYTTGMEGIAVYDVAVADSFYYARVYVGLYRTRNDSILWERVPNNIGTANVWGVNTVNNVVFARVYGITGLYRSIDNGTTFTSVPEGGSYAPGLFVKDGVIFIIKDGFGLLYSTDEGESWQTWVSGLTNTMLICMDLSNSTDTTLVGGGDIGPGALVDYILRIYTTGNPYGEDIRDGLPLSTYPYIRVVFDDNGRIFAAPSGNGLWYRDDFMVGINEIYNDLTSQSRSQNLMHVFPNPAGEQFIVQLKENIQSGNLIVFDPLGKVIRKISLSQDDLNIQIDASTLCQGVYYVVLLKEGYIFDTKKLIKVNY